MQQQVISTTLPMLILGLGWTGQFLSSLLLSQNMNYAATTRDGRNHTISWSLNCSQVDVSALPFAETVLVTFPVMQPECMSDLMDKYQEKHAKTPQWVLLSSTRPFVGNPANRHTPLDKSKDTGRMGAEDVVIQRGGSVMHLAGLWGDQRQPKGWVPRFPTADALRNKLLARQLHLVHGKDVARAILAVHGQFKAGERWLITDGGCYDWIKLFLTWGSQDQIKTMRDLAQNDDQCREALGDGTLEDIVERGGVKPRLDSSEFWKTFHLTPNEFLHIE